MTSKIKVDNVNKVSDDSNIIKNSVISAEISKIVQFAKTLNLIVIEDAAPAIYSKNLA